MKAITAALVSSSPFFFGEAVAESDSLPKNLLKLEAKLPKLELYVDPWDATGMLGGAAAGIAVTASAYAGDAPMFPVLNFFRLDGGTVENQTLNDLASPVPPCVLVKHIA